MSGYEGTEESKKSKNWHKGEGQLLHEIMGELRNLGYNEMVVKLDENRELYLKELVSKLQPYRPKDYHEERFATHLRVYLADGVVKIKDLVDPTIYGGSENIDRLITLIVERYGIQALFVNDLKGFLKNTPNDLVAKNAEDFVSILSINKVVEDDYLMKSLVNNWDDYIRKNEKVKNIIEDVGEFTKEEFLSEIDKKSKDKWVKEKEINKETVKYLLVITGTKEGDKAYSRYLGVVEDLKK